MCNDLAEAMKALDGKKTGCACDENSAEVHNHHCLRSVVAAFELNPSRGN